MGLDTSKLSADGYRTEKVLRKLSPPWYQLPPLDFVTETLWPGEIRDERIIDITMVPEQPVASEELNARANTLRLQAAQGMATGLPPNGNQQSQRDHRSARRGLPHSANSHATSSE